VARCGWSFGQHVHAKKGLWAPLDQVAYGGSNGTSSTAKGRPQGPVSTAQRNKDNHRGDNG